jgi:transposase-like protein
LTPVLILSYINPHELRSLAKNEQKPHRRRGRDRLAGAIEVDETYIGGERPGKRGRGAEGKTLVAIAVEDKGDAGIGRIRLSIVPDASSSSLTAFIQQCIDPGATVYTDDWPAYKNVQSFGYHHEIKNSKGLKIAHLVDSLLKR